jgi:hypothetical protein
VPTPGGEYEDSKKAAFRAAARNDIGKLGKVLDTVPVDIWKEWTNGAGEDLLSLSLKRDSSHAYALLAKALGLIEERKCVPFEERETVWVLMNGQILARQATVVEAWPNPDDVPEDADKILLEFWDDDQPPIRVESCCVLKVN